MSLRTKDFVTFTFMSVSTRKILSRRVPNARRSQDLIHRQIRITYEEALARNKSAAVSVSSVLLLVLESSRYVAKFHQIES